MRLEQILEELARLRPGSRAAAKLCAAGDHALFKVVRTGGLPGASGLVTRLNRKGRRFEPFQRGAGYCYWREDLGARAFELRVQANRHLTMAGVHYLAIPSPKPLAPAQRRRHEEQQRFYERYRDIGRRAYKGGRIKPAERTLLLVGEFEADVNNGGFSQYLSNKGRRRAEAAVRALEAIRARKTAGMLKDALAGKSLDALDERFYRAPEDLASLGDRYFSGKASAGR